jgi:outer membrane protein
MNKPALLTCLLAASLMGPASLVTGQALTQQAAIAAALERNFTIAIESLNPEIARQTLRQSKGTFDPVLSSSYTYDRREVEGSSTDEESASASIGLGSTLPIGTEWSLSVQAADRTNLFDPVLGTVQDNIASFAGITVTQPVLRGFGLDGSYGGVRSARENLKASQFSFEAEVMDIVESTIAAFQSLWFARENLRIAERNRDLALKLLDDNRKRVDSGAMAPLDLVQAESEAALREVSVISARSFLDISENNLRSLISDDPATVLDLPVDILPPPAPVEVVPQLSRDLAFALDNRPILNAARAGLNVREWELRDARRNALPQLDLVASAGRYGRASTLSDSLQESFNDGPSGYSVGAVLSVPFPNRTRSATKVSAYLRRNSAQLSLEQLEQDIRLELDDASTRLVADWDRIQAARKARELAEQSLEAEEKKLQAGTSSTFVVLRLQGDLANAEIREINALSDYTISVARYQRSLGRILEANDISLSAEKP